MTIRLTDEQWDEFTALLNAPVEDSPRLRDLLRATPPWAEPTEDQDPDDRHFVIDVYTAGPHRTVRVVDERTGFVEDEDVDPHKGQHRAIEDAKGRLRRRFRDR